MPPKAFDPMDVLKHGGVITNNPPALPPSRPRPPSKSIVETIIKKLT